jgi:hypothetical protein
VKIEGIKQKHGGVRHHSSRRKCPKRPISHGESIQKPNNFMKRKVRFESA